jgi:hypothetical protein
MRKKNAHKFQSSRKKSLQRARKLSGLGRTWEAAGAMDEFFSDYSPAEWAEIEKCVAALPGAPLTALDRRYLRNTGRFYQFDLAERKRGNYRTPSMRAKSWASLANALAKLRANLELAGQDWYGVNWHKSELSLLNRAGHKPRIVKFGEFSDLLVEFENSVREFETPVAWRTPIMISSSGRLEPRIVYFQQVLWFWTEHVSGELKFSRNADISGPLVRFFRAVTDPVMGNDAPSLQSIPDIVKRQKTFYKKLAAINRGERAT